jgi:hypothetical protein
MGIYIAMMFLDSCCGMDDHKYYKYNILYHVLTMAHIHIICIIYRIAGWWFFKHVLFSIIYGIILPIDELIFFKMVKTTNQITLDSLIFLDR